MPQLIPIYFVSQVAFGFIMLLILLYIYSKYLLPLYLQIIVTRKYITKLGDI